MAITYLLSLSLRLDVVQRRIAAFASEQLESSLEIPLKAESLLVKDLDEIILKNVLVLDQKGDTALAIKEATAHISPYELLNNRIQINTLTAAAPDIRLSRASKESPLNIQFILDKLQTEKDPNSKALSVHINQIIIYDGKFSYDVHDIPAKEALFDPAHIAVNDIRCNVSLRKFIKDELDLLVRSIRGHEKSGLTLNKLKAGVKASNGNIKLRNIELELPNSRIASDSIAISFDPRVKKALEITANINGERVTPSDFSALNPEIAEKIPAMTFNLNCHSDSISSRTAISANSFNNDISLKTIATIDKPYDNDRNAKIYVRELSLSKERISQLQSLIKNNSLDIAEKIEFLDLTAEAEISNKGFSGNATAETGNGNITTEMSYNNNGVFDIVVSGYDIDIEKLAGINEPLKCSLETKAKGCINDTEKNIEFSGSITDLESSRYLFAPIEFTGAADVANNRFKTSISSTDPGATAQINIDYTNKKGHSAILSLNVDSINPCLIGVYDKLDGTFSFNMNGEFNSRDKNNSLMNVKVQNLTFRDSCRTSTVRNLHFCDTRTEEQRLVILNSDFIKLSVVGLFDYSSIVNSIYKQTIKHVPSLVASNDTTTSDNNYIFNCDIKDSHFISHVLKLPFVINAPSFINGTCYDQNRTLTLNTAINNIDIKKSKYKTIGLNGKSTDERLTLETIVIKPSKKTKKNNVEDDLKINLSCALFNDTIQNLLVWDNSKTKNKKCGKVELDATVGRDANDILLVDAYVQPNSITHNDSTWYISGGRVSGNMDKINISGLYLYNDSQHLRLNGDIGKSPEDTLSISASNLEVSTIFDLVKFRILKFNGNATGSAYASALLSAPDVNGNFQVDSFKIDDGYLGKADLNIGWRNIDKSIFLNADIHNDNNKITKVNGLLSQANDTINIKVDADEVNAVFINKFVKSFMSDITGTASGNVELHGKWRGIDMRGAVALNCSARINPTNVRYTFHGDSLYLTSGKLSFNEARVTDKRGNEGWLSGNVTHYNLGKWECDLYARCNDVLVYDTYNFDQIPVYGTVYATGTANLKASDKGLFLKAEVSNGDNSRIVYNASESGSVRDNKFITFIDSNKKLDIEKIAKENSLIYENLESKLNLDFLLDVNEGLQIKVYTNLKSDDYIDLYGKGTVNAIYDEKDGFSLKGNIDLDRGKYKITVQDIFTKEFNIAKGSSLQFNGNPYDANLDLKTKYLVPSVSLSTLSTEVANRKNVKVNCLLDITGTLASPILNFDLELPEGSEEEKEILASAISTQEQKNMQFIYLLGLGRFYTYDYGNQVETDTQNTTAVESLISNTLSSQLNNMLGQIINNGNWNISGNFSTNETGWNDMEVEGMLEGRLLNDRLLINGNFGYRENPVANRNFIGDFELQLLLNKKGTISLKAYSKTNDRYFSKTNLTTQGVGIALRHDFNKWLWWKNDKKKDKKEKRKEE